MLATGRAPDGAHYELFGEKVAQPPPEPNSTCLSVWWPRVPAASGAAYCTAELPPENAFGRRHGKAILAKPWGSLQTASPATRHLLLQGFARGRVQRVRVIFKDPSGVWRDAPVQLVRVSGGLRERIGARGSFGYFLSFLPPSVARHYGGIPPGRADGNPAIQVIAYGDGGRELGRVSHRN